MRDYDKEIEDAIACRDIPKKASTFQLCTDVKDSEKKVLLLPTFKVIKGKHHIFRQFTKFECENGLTRWYPIVCKVRKYFEGE